MNKNILKLILSIILMTSWWWSFAILESFNDPMMQILGALPFLVCSVILAILGAVLFTKTIVKILNIKDRNL